MIVCLRRIRLSCCNICNFIRIMFSILSIFAYLMADVAPWGHGGDGAGDPPLPPGGFRGTHETDAVPLKRVRGKAKNEKLRRLVKAGGACIAYV
ncbi:hypothetical protein HanLR1_Chr08g0273201 [Helianthus annuus]|nr:hypothetical protein HanLR1_Chr08g0273201 [Helianthus annuus]